MGSVIVNTEEAVAAYLLQGGIGFLPWREGLWAMVCVEEAAERMAQIKGREGKKPFFYLAVGPAKELWTYPGIAHFGNNLHKVIVEICGRVTPIAVLLPADSRLHKISPRTCGKIEISQRGEKKTVPTVGFMFAGSSPPEEQLGHGDTFARLRALLPAEVRILGTSANKSVDPYTNGSGHYNFPDLEFDFHEDEVCFLVRPSHALADKLPVSASVVYLRESGFPFRAVEGHIVRIGSTPENKLRQILEDAGVRSIQRALSFREVHAYDYAAREQACKDAMQYPRA